MSEPSSGELQRHFGLLHAVALNVTQIVGAGVFATIPLMLVALPGPMASGSARTRVPPPRASERRSGILKSVRTPPISTTLLASRGKP